MLQPATQHAAGCCIWSKAVYALQVLDLGTGTGDNAIWLGQQGLAVTGVDLSADAIKIARKRLAEAGAKAPQDVTFLQADATQLQSAMGTQQFDVALDAATLHGLPTALRPLYVKSLTLHVRPNLPVGAIFVRCCRQGRNAPDRSVID